MKERLITGLDIGTSFVRVVTGQFNPQDGNFYIIGCGEVPSAGISKGVIVSIEDAVSSITSCLEQSERMIGSPIERVFVGISGAHIITQESKGVITVSRANGEIKEDDVDRAIQAAQAVATPPNYEILHVIPKNFIIDNQTGIKDPLGMTGIRLEVATQIILGLSSQIKNLTKAVYRTGVEIDDLVLSVLANAEAVLTKRQKELGVALVNIGESTSAAAVFEEGDLLHTFIIPLGSNHITADIAIGLRTSLDVAESIKLEYGQAVSENVNKKEEINLGDFSESENESVSLKYISEIIEARVEEIFDMVDKELIKIDRSGLLPAGVVLTGGGAQLPGIIEVAKKRFRLPASLGLPLNINTAIDKINNLSFTAAIGLAYWGAETIGGKSGKPFHLPSFKSVSELAAHAASWLKNLIRF
ncbi:cell division protein FtsA [Candidatus Kuenenbacteria bacterium RIFCSPLOWO2_12_FULL_42_13]|uniref:Cell division protein FtsA n=3 Tax=Candidatus Kueneniibacteriota TaxID=1752740 RepID=A0A1F6G1G1_9BACT|nr:MAG: cell division protein FtsA [Candidatus Kuenenbacteria bacterium RIFCSPHIGHO2_02_FULL_42_29]OGG91665.1 MAG: cell division protein FtsA [Candidatus Kuenenbacteria bacterium RIFCSPLOWO2_02_FULL_42_16]OGG91952.1 MAG: cell division protein FtsA [Candidatus Kuenenbacteria bacterium RIFCSPLOWO2_12_FULL_42_13]OGG98588.1 MAG: cell division protein FtsA [Candidatus Kuenenbacteria bacterium RIFCSPHIGHO2_12_FULL_42_14]